VRRAAAVHARAIDATSFTIDRSFTLADLFETKATQAYGITWDGSSIWISVAGDSNSLAQIDPTTGAIIKAISSPTEDGPSDLDFDGTDLWLSTGTGDAFQMTTPNGTTLKHFSLPLGSQRDDGIAFRTGELFVGELFGGIEVYDPSSGNMIGSVVHEDGTAFDQTEMGPPVFAGDDFVMLSSLGITKYQAIKYVP
jgi:hypothetical protein